LEGAVSGLENGTPNRAGTNSKPNVIVILSESFFDITKIENLKLSEDPTPNFRKYIQEYSNGDIGSITFGGGTNKVEGEFLTGLLDRHMPEGWGLDKEINALPNIFKHNGYETAAVHTYYKTFYNRDIYYDKIGFDKFIGYEDMQAPEFSGPYVSDSYFADQVINTYENKNSPIFIFGISMENHQPYNDKYENNNIKILNGDISEESKNLGENFITGLNSADKGLKKIIDYFENIEEDTIILFFGDHLPTLGSDFKFYRELGFVEKEGKLVNNGLLKIVSPPYFIYSNYGLNIESYELIGSNFLGNYLLNIVGLEKPLFYYFIDKAFEQSDYMSRFDLFVGKGNKIYDSVPYYFRGIEEMYKMFQHDILSDENYVAGRLEKYY
jgi:hypothetical protein